MILTGVWQPLRAPQRVHRARCGQRAGDRGRPGFGMVSKGSTALLASPRPCWEPKRPKLFNESALCLNIGRENQSIPAVLAAQSSMARLGSSTPLGLGTMTKCWQRDPVAWGSRGARLWFPRGLVGVAPLREGRRATLTLQGSFCSCPPAETKPCLAVATVTPLPNVAAILPLLVTPMHTLPG